MGTAAQEDPTSPISYWYDWSDSWDNSYTLVGTPVGVEEVAKNLETLEEASIKQGQVATSGYAGDGTCMGHCGKRLQQKKAQLKKITEKSDALIESLSLKEKAQLLKFLEQDKDAKQGQVAVSGYAGDGSCMGHCGKTEEKIQQSGARDNRKRLTKMRMMSRLLRQMK